MTDRLFLSSVVREIGPALRGSRVRNVRVDRSGHTVSLALSHPPPRVVSFYLGSRAPGLFRQERSSEPSKPTPREAKLTKWLASARVSSIDTSELDRVVTVELEQTRLSGKKKSIGIVFEIAGTRVSLFFVDRDTERIVDAFSFGGARLAVGERFRKIAPPPHAAIPARNYEELEKRLAETSADGRGALLYATGWTPLLVKELQYLMDEKGESMRSAFDMVHHRLLESQAALYVTHGADRVFLSPIILESQHGFRALPAASFNEAMAEAVRLSVRAERARALRQRLDAALKRNLKRSKRLRSKLREQQEALPDPAELRRQGETLLAGMASAARQGDSMVRVPDPFDADGRMVELAIDPRLDLAANAERLFRRSRKTERTRVELTKRLEDLERALAHVEGAVLDLAEAKELEELESLTREAEEQGLVSRPDPRSRPKRREEKLPPREFRTASGRVVLVGRSARSNEDVTFRFAKPGDLWFHASGIPGSHVVLRTDSSAPDEDDVLFAASLAARFSKARHDSYVEVIVTERRHVTKIKGAPPGLVRVGEHRTVRVRPAADDDVR